jgi:hypothetical protein
MVCELYHNKVILGKKKEKETVGNFQPRSETVLTWRIASVRELAAL